MNEPVIHNGYESGSHLAETMRNIQNMFDRYEEGSLIPSRALTNAAERKPREDVDPEQMAYLYDKAKCEGRSLNAVAQEAGITTNNLYRWAKKMMLPTDKENFIHIEGAE